MRSVNLPLSEPVPWSQKTVPPYALVMGNPARHVGWMSEYGHRLEFNEEGIASLPGKQ